MMRDHLGFSIHLAAILLAVLLIPTKYIYLHKHYLPNFLSPVSLLEGLIIFFIIISVFRQKEKILHISRIFWIAYSGLTIIIILSLAYTPNVDFGQTKTVEFVTTTSLACFAPFFIFNKQKNIKIFVVTILTMGILFSLLILTLNPFFQSIYFKTKLGSNYLAIQHIAGMASLIVLYYFVMKERNIKRLFGWFFLLVILVFGLVYPGGKGPPLALFFTTILMCLVSIRFKSSYRLMIMSKWILSFPIVICVTVVLILFLLSSKQNVKEKLKTGHFKVGAYAIDQTSHLRDDLSKLGTYALYEGRNISSSNPEPLPWADYRVTLTIRSDDNDSIGVMFRYIDPSNYYRFSWNSELGYRRLTRCKENKYTLLAEDSIPYETGRTYHVEIIAQGSILTVKIDGNSIFVVSDTSLSSGTIALYCWGNQGSHFDDVRVTDLQTDVELLSSDFNEGLGPEWKFVDEGSISEPSDWIIEAGTLLQNSNIASLPPGWLDEAGRLDEAILIFRFRSLLSKGNYAQVERLKNIETALKLFFKHPLIGVGIGGFSVYGYKMEGVERFKYPHNIVLEILSELGLFGFSLFSVIIFFAFKNLILLHRRHEYVSSVFLSLLIFTLLNSMTSQHIANPALFSFIGGSFAINSKFKKIAL